jgi:protein-S-isoprenylcysteine O-methyltransferase Ste14
VPAPLKAQSFGLGRVRTEPLCAVSAHREHRARFASSRCASSLRRARSSFSHGHSADAPVRFTVRVFVQFNSPNLGSMTMSNDLFAIVLANLIFIGLLPFLFFRRDGSFNFRWWLTGMPFFLSASAVTAGRLQMVTRWPGLPEMPLSTLAVIIALGSMAMMGWTVGSHRVPLALWHQENDAAVSIVSWGPYKYVRHPFYASFILTQIAAVLAFPHAGTAAGLVYAVLALSLTARREEARLLASKLGQEYRSYGVKTGRLVPGIGRLAT